MKTVLIVLGIVIALFILFMIFVMKPSTPAATKINPITSIGFGECMGFKLGDKWNYVLSRMKHLNLITEDQQVEYSNKYKEEYEDRKRLGMDSLPGGMSMEFVANTPNLINIENIKFLINNGYLTCIDIQLSPEQTTIENVEQLVNATLTMRFSKQPLEIKDKVFNMNVLSWNSPNYDSIVSIDLNKHTVFVSASEL